MAQIVFIWSHSQIRSQPVVLKRVVSAAPAPGDAALINGHMLIARRSFAVITPAPGDAALINGHLSREATSSPSPLPAPGDAALINGHSVAAGSSTRRRAPHRATPP